MKTHANPLIAKGQDRRLKQVERLFPELRGSERSTLLSFGDYTVQRPKRFFNRQAFEEVLAWLRVGDRTTKFGMLVSEHRATLERTFRTLDEVNRYEWHDSVLGSDVEQLRQLDREVLPTYMKLVEGVLVRFLHLPAMISRAERGRGHEGLDAYNIIDELREAFPTSVRSYNHEVRNGIAHGGVHYTDDDVVFSTKSKTFTRSRSGLVRLFDDLLDDCNGLAAAFRMLLISSELPRDQWPQAILLEELKASADAPWWTVEACLERDSAKSQLNILVAVTTADPIMVHYSCLQTAAAAASLVPGYDRYFIGMRASGAWPGWAGFDGEKLRTAIGKASDVDLSAIYGAAEDGLIFFVPKTRLPRWLRALNTIQTAMRVELRAGVRDSLAFAGIPEVRILTCHHDPLLVTRASVVAQDATVDSIRNNALGIMGQVQALALARGNARPPGYTEVSVFDTDLRCRRLNGYGLGANLVCRMTVSFDPRKRRINLFGSRVETHVGVRIEWNTNWPGLNDHLKHGVSPVI